MTRPIDRPAAILLIVLAVACANPGSRSPGTRADLRVITQEQLMEHSFSTVFEAVQSLRSNWLTTRGVDSFSTPSQVQVYFDNVKLGGVETLRGVTIHSINYIEHFDGVAATERWGLDHGGGVIFVSSQPRRGATRRF